MNTSIWWWGATPMNIITHGAALTATAEEGSW